MPVITHQPVLAKPFLKWAGGKGQLLEQIIQYLPENLKNNAIKRYVEPFIGGGSVFFYITQRYQFEECYISDVNQDLILTYKVIQNNVKNLIERLTEIQNKYSSFTQEQQKEYYCQIRFEFNQKVGKEKFDSSESVARAAQVIFLNRTCFNGLFRVNSKGKFNVPIGKYKNPRICDAENLKAVSKVLERTQIHHGDFQKSDEFINQESFVYFDPPYRPLNKTSNFTSYAGSDFNDNEQIRLRDFYHHLHGKGAKLMLSNSDPKNEDINDNFFDRLYQEHRILRLKASRNINSNASSRGKINEILVVNYPK